MYFFPYYLHVYDLFSGSDYVSLAGSKISKELTKKDVGECDYDPLLGHETGISLKDIVGSD
jgi:hypothetical protein